MFEDNLWLNLTRAAGILLSVVVAAWVVTIAAKALKRRMSSRASAGSISATIDRIARPIIILILSEGVIAVLWSVKGLKAWHDELQLAAVAAVIAISTYWLARITESLLTWQVNRIKLRAARPPDIAATIFLKRVAQIIVYTVGLLVLLEYLTIPISPLIASLGVGGLAVALALQPTMGNFFAGTQVISDRVARIGDFIEIDDKTRGYVTDIGWRSTKIRTPVNKIIFIPNSILANSQVLNYNMPSPALTISVFCGVSYDSNLVEVKRIALETAAEIVERMDEAVKTFEPWVGFDNFGDSNIMFGVSIQAKDRLSSFNLKSELIMRLHERFRKENIAINYPVRVNYLKWQSDAGSDERSPSEKH